jgi:hypothetical protein
MNDLINLQFNFKTMNLKMKIKNKELIFKHKKQTQILKGEALQEFLEDLKEIPTLALHREYIKRKSA